MLKRLFARTSPEKTAFDVPNNTGPGSEAGATRNPIARDIDQHGLLRAMLMNKYYIAAVLLLTAACLIAIENVAMAVAWRVPIPFSDDWGQFPGMIGLRDAGFPFESTISYLWWQHNEHRIVVPKIIYLIDMTLFSYRGHFPIVCIFLFQTLMASMLTWLLVGKGRNSWEIVLLVALIVIAAFDLIQGENFASTFQTSFVGCFAFAVAAFVLYAKFTLTTRRPYLWCAVLFAILASLSLASGLFVWIVLALLSYLIHTKRYMQSLSFVGAFAGFLLLYVHGYTSPSYHANPIDSLLHHPLMVLDYLTVWLGNVAGTVRSARLLGSLALLVLLVVMICLLPDKNRNRRIEIYTLLGICVFVLMSGLVTSLGRINFGAEQAMAGRYATPVLILWVSLLGCLLLLALELVKPLEVGVLVGLILVAFVGLVIRNDQGAAALIAFQNQQVQAYLAVVTGRYQDQPELLLPVFPVPNQILDKVELLRSHDFSAFNAADASPLRNGSTYPPSHMQGSNRCIGHIDAVTAAGKDTYQVTGWAWDQDLSTYPEWIVLVRDGNIVGLGRPGIPRPDLRAAVPSVDTRRVGWQAIAGGLGGIGTGNIEAYISSKSGRHCRFSPAYE